MEKINRTRAEAERRVIEAARKLTTTVGAPLRLRLDTKIDAMGYELVAAFTALDALPDTGEANGCEAEIDRLNTALAESQRKVESLTIKDPRELAMRETIHGQGLSMQAMSRELAESQAEVARLRDLFRIDGEQHAKRIRGLTEQHETRLQKYMEAVRDRDAELARLRSPTTTGEDIKQAEKIVDDNCEKGIISTEDSNPTPLVDDIVSTLAAARHSSAAAMRERAADVAEADTGTTECPYGTDKPGDPTWTHTDESICPICGETGLTDRKRCRGFARQRIASAIRALPTDTNK